ncbi:MULTISPECIES: preprotein translocase subunit SecE [Corallincola]|uniref:Protein translocase subunit SecE n=3 Tax=Corallincola TaxID=1775176 RepID=A0A368N0S7_9GAMM|nr:MULTISPECIES: preprotein translocase subunit SecE [Corallincola]RCU43234.1 preprotein translocase subunit SecE [Corallincola holothuriorum]TAA39788.1 preprotein translocase subunit SecE [Corallincola spongiicola]TCI01206.1 preprotein translocase subunit SecE [Corallincola luteus]
MNANTETQSGGLDGVKWLVVFAVLIAAVVGNYYFAEQSVLVRAGAVVLAVAVAALIALQTEKGRNALVFSKEARVEVKKVVWPTRQEAVHTTLIVFAAVVIMSLLLWGLDGIMVRLVAFFTGVSI